MPLISLPFCYSTVRKERKKCNDMYSKAHWSKFNWSEYLQVAYQQRARIFFHWYTLLACMSRMIEYIAIKDDNVMSHFCKFLQLGLNNGRMSVVIGNWDGRVPCYYTWHTEIALKCLDDNCKLSRFAFGNDWYDYFLPCSFHASTSSTVSNYDFNAKLTAMEHVLYNVLYHHSQIMPKHLLIHVKYARMILKITMRSCKHLVVHEIKWSPDMRCDTLCSYTIALFGNEDFIQFAKLAKKEENDIVIFNGNVLGLAWHTWCKKGINGMKMNCFLLPSDMQLFISIDFRTICLKYGLPFIRTVYSIFCFILTKDKSLKM